MKLKPNLVKKPSLGGSRSVKISIYKYDAMFWYNATAAAVFCTMYLLLGITNGGVLVAGIVAGWVLGHFVRKLLFHIVYILGKKR